MANTAAAATRAVFTKSSAAAASVLSDSAAATRKALGERVFVEVQRMMLRQQQEFERQLMELHRLTRAMRAGARGWTTADRSSPEGVIHEAGPLGPLGPLDGRLAASTLAAPTLAASTLAAGLAPTGAADRASPDGEERSGDRAGSSPVEGDGTESDGRPESGSGGPGPDRGRGPAARRAPADAAGVVFQKRRRRGASRGGERGEARGAPGV